jgi:hypothetical protein
MAADDWTADDGTEDPRTGAMELILAAWSRFYESVSAEIYRTKNLFRVKF